jgi:hypothetical protein
MKLFIGYFENHLGQKRVSGSSLWCSSLCLKFFKVRTGQKILDADYVEGCLRVEGS